MGSWKAENWSMALPAHDESIGVITISPGAPYHWQLSDVVNITFEEHLDRRMIGSPHR
jgi:hypothetical protein